MLLLSFMEKPHRWNRTCRTIPPAPLSAIVANNSNYLFAYASSNNAFCLWYFDRFRNSPTTSSGAACIRRRWIISRCIYVMFRRTVESFTALCIIPRSHFHLIVLHLCVFEYPSYILSAYDNRTMLWMLCYDACCFYCFASHHCWQSIFNYFDGIANWISSGISLWSCITCEAYFWQSSPLAHIWYFTNIMILMER